MRYSINLPGMGDDDSVILNLTQAEVFELRSILAMLLEGDGPADPTLRKRARALLLGEREEGEI